MKILALQALLLISFGSAAAESDDHVHEKSLEEATSLANAGNSEAVHDLCYRDIYGRNAEKNSQKALQWCSYGAALGIDSSQVLLAELYYGGNGTPESNDNALYWYKKAADQGHEHAFLMLYFIYKEGHGVVTDMDVAEKYLQQAVAAGYEPALKVMKERQAAKE